LQLLGRGMGSVFIILALLIGIITIVSKLVPEEVVSIPVSLKPGVDSNHVAAISAALHQHRNRR
jgi:Na+-transporting methylmalonyl-CoA/oxaloacetate decarboxylase gamma subunit